MDNNATRTETYGHFRMNKLEIERDTSYHNLLITVDPTKCETFHLADFNLGYDRTLEVMGAKNIHLENVTASGMSFDAENITLEKKCWTHGISAPNASFISLSDMKRPLELWRTRNLHHLKTHNAVVNYLYAHNLEKLDVTGKHGFAAQRGNIGAQYGAMALFFSVPLKDQNGEDAVLGLNMLTRKLVTKADHIAEDKINEFTAAGNTIANGMSVHHFKVITLGPKSV